MWFHYAPSYRRPFQTEAFEAQLLIMSKKRGAERELNRDDLEEEDEDVQEQAGTWQPADAETLKGRTILKVKRSAPKSASAAPRPSFNLMGGDDDEKKPEAEEEKKQEAAEEKPAEAAAEENPFFKALGRKPGDWDCAVCCLMNKAAVVRCISCEEWKPGHEPAEGAAAAAPENAGFSFGASSEESSEAPASAEAGSSEGFGFGFGGDSGSAEGAFSFGDSSNFSLGDVAAGGFSFGSVTGDESAFGQSSEGGLEDSSADSSSATAELFKNAEAEPRGDDEDTTVAKVHCKVYKMGPQMQTNEDGSQTQVGQTFLEQGQGELRLNLVTKGDKKTARALMRADMTHRLVINAPLFPGMTKATRGELRLQFVSNDLDGSPAVYLLKFASAQDTKAIDSKIDELLASL